MVDVVLPYGDGQLAASLPERATVVHSSGAGSVADEALPDPLAAVRAALAQPLGLPPIARLVRPGASVLIAFDDGTVSSGGAIRRVVIEQLLAELAMAGVREEDVTLVCANALHRKWTRTELATLLGAELEQRFGSRLLCHDAEDCENLVYLGRTANGYDVEVNRRVADTDLTIYVNAGVNRGFTGGWKSVCIGLSTWRSIRHTHHPDGMSMSVHNNRMHAVLDEMGAHLEERLGKRIFKVETIMVRPGQLSHVWAGGVNETRAQALTVMARRHPPRRAAAAPVDVLIYGIPNSSPYAAFARVNPILTLISSGLGYLGGYIDALGKPGCSVIMAAPSPDDWDMEHHPSYKRAWDEVLPQTRDAYEIEARFTDAYAGDAEYIDRYRNGVAFHPVHAILATQPLKRLRRAGRVIVAGAVDAAVPQRLGFAAAPGIEAALAVAERLHGSRCSIACIVDDSAPRLGALSASVAM